MDGADGEIRTHDLPLTRRLLCQLSYVGKLVCKIARKFARAWGCLLKQGPPQTYGEASKFVGTLGYHRRR